MGARVLAGTGIKKRLSPAKFHRHARTAQHSHVTEVVPTTADLRPPWSRIVLPPPATYLMVVDAARHFRNWPSQAFVFSGSEPNATQPPDALAPISIYAADWPVLH